MADMTAAEWIAGRRELLGAATQGPWCDMEGIDWEARVVGGGLEVADTGRASDAALIADARTSLPAALDALDAVLTYHSPGEGSSQGYTPSGYGDVEPYCAGCEANDEYAVTWPCLTVLLVMAALQRKAAQ